MRLRRIGVLALPALVAACAALTAGSARAAGPTCTVSNTGPADYSTIQAAVSDPGCTVINVAAGTYNEQVTISRNGVTLNGAQAGNDARSRSGPESIIDNACAPIMLEADNITINGFTIEGQSLPDPCINSGIWSNPGYSGTNGGFTIVNNIVQDNISGIELDSTCTNPTLVQHNLIQNNDNPGSGSGNGIQTNFGLCNATIDSNTFSGDTSSSLLVVAPSSNVNFTNNTLTAGANEGLALFDVSGATISGNTSLGTMSTAVDVAGGDSNIAINGNVLANGDRGIAVEDPFSVGANSAVSAHMNCISGNATAGLEEDSGGYTPVAPGSLDATSNWWGSSTGPTIASNPGGTGDKIVDQDHVVAYSPFLTSATGAACPPATTPLVTKTQAMNGDQKVKQGSTLSAGFDFTMPGNRPAATVGFLGSKVTFNATCASGTPGSMTITVNMPNESYTDPANSSAWFPSGDQNAASTYQGSAVVPSFCDPGALVRLQQGGTFSTGVTSTDKKDKVNVRWHYMDVTGGGWSGTYSVVPS